MYPAPLTKIIQLFHCCFTVSLFNQHSVCGYGLSSPTKAVVRWSLMLPEDSSLVAWSGVAPVEKVRDDEEEEEEEVFCFEVAMCRLLC